MGSCVGDLSVYLRLIWYNQDLYGSLTDRMRPGAFVCLTYSRLIARPVLGQAVHPVFGGWLSLNNKEINTQIRFFFLKFKNWVGRE